MSCLDTEILDELRDLLGADELHEITGAFIAQLEVQLQQLDPRVVGANLDEGARVAHSLKGGAGNLGASQLSAAASAIEHNARAGDVAMFASVLATLPDLARQAVEELRARGYAPPAS